VAACSRVIDRAVATVEAMAPPPNLQTEIDKKETK
jgi:hypothetical protein